MLAILSVALSLAVYSEATDGLDRSITAFFSERTGDPAMDALMQLITESGDVFNMLIFGIVVLLIPRTRRIGITLMILIVVSTLLTGYVKCGIDRDRPDSEFEGIQFPVSISRDTFALFCEGGFDASYPSGHAARSVTFAIILGYALSERFPRGGYLMFLYPALVSLSRVYVQQHYLMDVIGGTVIGIMLAGVLAHRTKLYKIFEKSET